MNHSIWLVGAGGTGSILYEPLVRYLAAWHRNHEGTFVLGVIDGDDVETHNLDRQMFTGNFVGGSKAEAVVSRYRPQTGEVHPLHEYLGANNIANRIHDGDIVLIAVDNYPARSHIERHVSTLDNAVVINGGNEAIDGSVQIWVRRDGKNVTPPISFLHDEIHTPGADRAEMTCEAIAQIAGGEQHIVANMQSATLILNALRLVLDQAELGWHEIHFDLNVGRMRPFDYRKHEDFTP